MLDTKYVPGYLEVIPGYLVTGYLCWVFWYYGIRFKGTLLKGSSTYVMRIPRYEGSQGTRGPSMRVLMY